MNRPHLTLGVLASWSDDELAKIAPFGLGAGELAVLLQYVVALRRDLRALLADRDSLEDRRRIDAAALAQHRRHAERVTQAAIEWLESARDRGDESRYTVIQTLPDVVEPVLAEPAPIAKTIEGPIAKTRIALGLEPGRMYSLDEIEAIYAERRRRAAPRYGEVLDRAIEEARAWFAWPA